MRYAIDLVDSEERLQDLYRLDCQEYGESNVDYPTFQDWWAKYDLGIRVAMLENEIAGAIGVWALDRDSIRRFIAGQIRESELQPLPHETLEAIGSEFWYISGLVIQPQFRGQLNSPLRLLLNGGVGQILNGGKIKYPAHVYALGSSPYGIALLSKLGFEQIKTADEMPDRAGLWWKQLTDRSEGRLLGR